MDYSDSPTPQSKGFPWGCLAFGCLGIILLVVGGIAALGFGGYWFYTSQINKYTSPDPMVIPTVEISDEEKEALEARVEQFQADMEAGTAEEALVLTEQEINALLASEGDFENTVYIDLEPDQVSAQVSFPTDELPGAGGRYFNGTVTLHVEVEEGNTIVLIEDASVNGQPVPESIMTELRGENLMEEASTDPEFQKIFTKLKELRIEKDAIVLIPAPPEQSEGDGTSEDATTDADSPPNEASDAATSGQEQAEVGSEPEMLEEIN